MFRVDVTAADDDAVSAALVVVVAYVVPVAVAVAYVVPVVVAAADVTVPKDFVAALAEVDAVDTDVLAVLAVVIAEAPPQ